MIYNFNLGIGWASSGVEYAQAYRGKVFRNLGEVARFIFTDYFPKENIAHMTENIGFPDEEIIWLYTFFTDTRIAPASFTLEDLEKTLGGRTFTFSREGKISQYHFANNSFYTAYMVSDKEDDTRVHRVEIVQNGCLIRKDYYTYCKIYSEYYAPFDGKARMYSRRFFNENGTIAYEEVLDEQKKDQLQYRFPERVLFSKEELVGYMVDRLQLTSEDIVILDRTTGIGQVVLQHAGQAKVGVIIHADHYSEGCTDEQNILWNNYYEYPFAMHKHIDFYVTATKAQKDLLLEQFGQYHGVLPRVYVVPVGALPQLTYPANPRKPYSLITASRLATEKHVDWLVDAVAGAHKTLPELTLDIYGAGTEKAKLEEKIKQNEAASYIRLMGQQKLDQVYIGYEAYLSGSTSEGFGLTLMEAVGSGLPIIGFDVKYGNQNFIDAGRNGYLLSSEDGMDGKERIQLLQEAIIRLFTEADLNAFHAHSYEVGKEYVEEEVEQKWKKALEQIR